jgi:hypothetical protein
MPRRLALGQCLINIHTVGTGRPPRHQLRAYEAGKVLRLALRYDPRLAVVEHLLKAR